MMEKKGPPGNGTAMFFRPFLSRRQLLEIKRKSRVLAKDYAGQAAWVHDK